MSYIDDFGIRATYGLDATGKGELAKESGAQNKYAIKQIVADVSGITSTTAVQLKGAFIPKGSIILRAYLAVTKAGATAATTTDIGTCKLDGTTVDADGLVDGATLAAQGNVGAGAQINKQVAYDEAITVLVSAAAGAAGFEGKLIVDYV
jgi:hypothetical protein